MRITAQAKTETRARILEAAKTILQREGWHGTTTRGIALAAGIGTGTLFNYFPTKEAIAATIIEEALMEEALLAEEDAAAEAGSPQEALFRFVWEGLRRLAPYRSFLGPAAETIFSPLLRPSGNHPGDEIRVAHLERVVEILVAQGVVGPLPAMALQLYWTLYLGFFAFWAADESPAQEDSLALLDQSLSLFVASLNSYSSNRKGSNEHE